MNVKEIRALQSFLIPIRLDQRWSMKDRKQILGKKHADIIALAISKF